MMRHPIHLHGHDFRLLNGQGDYVPLKNIVDIMPMETDTLEFDANAEGDWFFHCHILYHMMAGMGRVFTYKDQAPKYQTQNWQSENYLQTINVLVLWQIPIRNIWQDCNILQLKIFL